MAVYMTRAVTLTTSTCRRRLKSDFYKPLGASQVFGRLSSTDTSNEQVDLESEMVDFAKLQEEERIAKLQDISGLTDQQKRRFRGQVPEIKNDYQQSTRYQRKLYGKLGAASGVDPRIAWPTRQQALEMSEENQEWEPTLEERLAKLREAQEQTANDIAMREKKIAENMAKMDEWIAGYRQRQVKKDEEGKKKEEKKRQLLEEAREFFGYYVDPRDSKFKEMLEEKEKQEKALSKKQKKEKRLAKLAARLQQMAQEGENKEENKGSSAGTSS